MSAMPTSDEYVTPCMGQHLLFDSRRPEDQAQAATLCRGCEVRSTCAEKLDEAIGSTLVAKSYISGTWAGRTFTPPVTVRDSKRAASLRSGKYPKGSENPCAGCGRIALIHCRDRCRNCYRALSSEDAA